MVWGLGMDFRDVRNFIHLLRRRPAEAVLIGVVFFLFMAALAYVTGLWGERGRQRASTAPPGYAISASPSGVHMRSATQGHPLTNQHTEGDQSPAVNVAPGGTSNITYDTPRPHSER